MNKIYTRYNITLASEEQKDILIATLSDWGIEGFEEGEYVLYASGSNNDIAEAEIDNYLLSGNIPFEKTVIPDQNWNKIWESNFEPVRVNDYVAVRADFHEPIAVVKHEIIITPKMSFGTGHHATTFLMIQLMQELNLKNARVFDFGTGTGILAILAEKEGAEKILAFDYDEWCILNAAENLVRNDCTRVALEKADSPPSSGEFDIVLANINKNIILYYFDQLENLVIGEGSILLSGLLSTDEPEVLAALAKSNMKMHKRTEKNGWIALHLQKSQLKN